MRDGKAQDEGQAGDHRRQPEGAPEQGQIDPLLFRDLLDVAGLVPGAVDRCQIEVRRDRGRCRPHHGPQARVAPGLVDLQQGLLVRRLQPAAHLAPCRSEQRPRPRHVIVDPRAHHPDAARIGAGDQVLGQCGPGRVVGRGAGLRRCEPGRDLRHVGGKAVIVERPRQHLPDRDHEGDQDEGQLRQHPQTGPPSRPALAVRLGAGQRHSVGGRQRARPHTGCGGGDGGMWIKCGVGHVVPRAVRSAAPGCGGGRVSVQDAASQLLKRSVSSAEWSAQNSGSSVTALASASGLVGMCGAISVTPSWYSPTSSFDDFRAGP